MSLLSVSTIAFLIGLWALNTAVVLAACVTAATGEQHYRYMETIIVATTTSDPA